MANIPPCLPGFGHISRSRDTGNGTLVARVQPGEFYVSGHEELISTMLGSCVSACICDPQLRLGGLNHFLLPERQQTGTPDQNTMMRYGSAAMERLIREILKQGGQRRRLQAKLVGGGRIIASMSDIGQLNIQFAREYLAAAGIAVLAEDLGGERPRKILYNPLTGALKVKKLHSLHEEEIHRLELRYREDLRPLPSDGKASISRD